MTVPSSTSKSSVYTGDGANESFAYPFRILAEAELLVTVVELATGVETVLTLTTDYTVNNVGDATGTIDTTGASSPWEDTHELILSRTMGFKQEIDLQNQGTYYPDTLEEGLDRLKMEVQQVKEETDRAVKVDITAAITPDDLLTAIGASVAAAAASAAAASTSEGNAADSETAAGSSETAAGVSEAKAEDWAEEAEDVEVEVGQYSALHWAAKAAEAADFYSKAELDAGQLDTRYYTETELDAGQLDTRYYTETEIDTALALLKVNAGTVATTSGTSVLFTGIPSWATHLVLVFDQVSTSSTGNINITIGDAGGLETAGYVSTSLLLVTTPSITAVTSTAEFKIQVASATREVYGHVIFDLTENNTWVQSHFLREGGSTAAHGGGSKQLSDTLTQIQLAITAGAFDAGAVTLLYE